MADTKIPGAVLTTNNLDGGALKVDEEVKKVQLDPRNPQKQLVFGYDREDNKGFIRREDDGSVTFGSVVQAGKENYVNVGADKVTSHLGDLALSSQVGGVIDSSLVYEDEGRIRVGKYNSAYLSFTATPAPKYKLYFESVGRTYYLECTKEKISSHLGDLVLEKEVTEIKKKMDTLEKKIKTLETKLA